MNPIELLEQIRNFRKQKKALKIDYYAPNSCRFKSQNCLCFNA